MKTVGYLFMAIRVVECSSNTQFYESWIFCLFTSWVFFPDKSFKLISKYTQKANITRYIKKKNTLQHLKLGKLKFGIPKIGIWVFDELNKIIDSDLLTVASQWNFAVWPLCTTMAWGMLVMSGMMSSIGDSFPLSSS